MTGVVPMLGVALLFLSLAIAVGRQRKRVSRLEVRCGAAESGLKDLSERVTQILLTPEDRKLLGISDPVVPSKPSGMACRKHLWSPSVLESARRPEARTASASRSGDRKVYTRKCVSCGWREARVWQSYSLKWEWVAD